MFPNLDAEMARRKITKGFLAQSIGKTPTTMGLKLSGNAPITLEECMQIKEIVAPECSVEYLFATSEEDIQAEGA